MPCYSLRSETVDEIVRNVEDALDAIKKLTDAGLVCGSELTDVDRDFLGSLTEEEVNALISIRSKTQVLPRGHIIPMKLI